MLDRTLLNVVVKESSQNRRYWAERPFAADQKEAIQAADVILVPWEDFREGIPAIFPEGTTDFATKLRVALSSDVAVAMNREAYQEIALHSRTRRLATLLVTTIALPSVAGALGNVISDLVKKERPGDTVELRLVVEGERGRCVSIEYKGPPSRAMDTVLGEVERCLPTSADLTQVSPGPPSSPVKHPAP